jgi:ribosomal protein L31E
MKENVVRFIQEFFIENVFDINVTPRQGRKRRRKIDQWKMSWLRTINVTSEEQRSAKTIKRVQQAVQYQFGVANVRIEESLHSVVGQNDANHKLDLFIPSEGTAIEICLSAIKNEFEKDILKAMLDRRVTILFIIARDYKTGKLYYGLHIMEQPGNQGIINMVKVFKLNVRPTQLCPE